MDVVYAFSTLWILTLLCGTYSVVTMRCETEDHSETQPENAL